MDEGESSEGTDTATSSDRGSEDSEDIDMSDVMPLKGAQASEHVFMQYGYYKRRWRRLTGKPVRMLRRGLRRFVRGRSKGRGFHRGMGRYGAPRFSISFVATLEDANSYLGRKGK